MLVPGEIVNKSKTKEPSRTEKSRYRGLDVKGVNDTFLKVEGNKIAPLARVQHDTMVRHDGARPAAAIQ